MEVTGAGAQEQGLEALRRSPRLKEKEEKPAVKKDKKADTYKGLKFLERVQKIMQNAAAAIKDLNDRAADERPKQYWFAWPWSTTTMVRLSSTTN